MYKLKKERLSDNGREYVCLICHAQFILFDSDFTVCPGCRAKGRDTIVAAKEMELEERNDSKR